MEGKCHASEGGRRTHMLEQGLGQKGQRGGSGISASLVWTSVGRDKRQSVTVRRCGFGENDDMTGEKYG